MVIKATYKSGITEEVECSEVLSSEAFYQEIDLVSVVIPEGVVQISSRAFCNCINLESVTFPTTLKFIGSKAFKHCISLKQCHIPSKLDSIRSYAFYHSGLEYLYIDSVCTIEQAAFYNCANLKSVTIDNDDYIKYIEQNAFHGCHNMISFNHKGIYAIRTSAFEDCLRLEKMDLTGLGLLYSYAFYNCISLTEITNLLGYALEDDPYPGSIFYNCFNIKSVTVDLSDVDIGIKEFADKYFLQSGEDSFSIIDINTE